MAYTKDCDVLDNEGYFLGLIWHEEGKGSNSITIINPETGKMFIYELTKTTIYSGFESKEGVQNGKALTNL